MDTQDIRTLKILEEIDRDQSPSQRDLATTLNVSLGLVNSFIKRLAKKGYFKVTTIPKQRVKYILTPKGAAEKTRLTYDYIYFSIKFYQETRKKILMTLSQLADEGVEKIVFLGTGEVSDMAFSLLKETRLQLVGVFDDQAAGDKFHHLVVSPLGRIKELSFDKIVVTAQMSTECMAALTTTHGLDSAQFINLLGGAPV